MKVVKSKYRKYRIQRQLPKGQNKKKIKIQKSPKFQPFKKKNVLNSQKDNLKEKSEFPEQSGFSNKSEFQEESEYKEKARILRKSQF